VVLTCRRTFARGYQLQQPSAQRHRGLTADGLAIRADGSSQVSGIGKIGPWPRSADNGRLPPDWPPDCGHSARNPRGVAKGRLLTPSSLIVVPIPDAEKRKSRHCARHKLVPSVLPGSATA